MSRHGSLSISDGMEEAGDEFVKTTLALRGDFMAAERRLLAWIRTSLQLIGFGFAMTKLFQSLAGKNVFVRGPAGNVWTAESVGMVLLAVGIFALAAAIVNHHRELNRLRATGLKRWFSLAKAVASALVLLGLAALLWLTVDFGSDR